MVDLSMAVLEEQTRINDRFAALELAMASVGNNAVKKKKNKGCYITPLYNTSGGIVSFSTIQTELATYKALRGIQFRYKWSDIETALGVYDFSTVDANNAIVRALGKRSIILIDVKSSHATDWSLTPNVCPSYMIGDIAYEGGQWGYNGNNPQVPAAGGKILKLWNVNVQARLMLLAQALGTHLNADVYFEAIGLTETSIGGGGNPIDTVGGVGTLTNLPTNYDLNYYYGYYKFLSDLNLNFPDTQVYGYCNYDRPIIKTMINGGVFVTGGETVPGFKVDGISLGSPNSLIDEPGLWTAGTNQGLYRYYPEIKGIINSIASWQPPDFQGNTKSNPTYRPTIQQLYDFTKNTLYADYLMVTRASDGWSDFITWLGTSGLGQNETLGL